MPTPPKTPPKPRTSSRSPRVRTHRPRFARLSRLWRRSRLAKFFLSITALILLYIISYPIYQIAHHYQRVSIETKDYATLSTTLKTLKPKLESVSPQGTVWEIEEYCEYGRVVFGRGPLSCRAHIVTDMYTDGGLHSVLSTIRHIDARRASEDVIVNKDQLDFNQDASSLRQGVRTVAGVSFSLRAARDLYCGGGYTSYKDGKLHISIGCSGSAEKEYYPLRHF